VRVGCRDESQIVLHGAGGGPQLGTLVCLGIPGPAGEDLSFIAQIGEVLVHESGWRAELGVRASRPAEAMEALNRLVNEGPASA